jgi:hypothetical protein
MPFLNTLHFKEMLQIVAKQENGILTGDKKKYVLNIEHPYCMMGYWIYLLLKFAVPKKCNYYQN